MVKAVEILPQSSSPFFFPRVKKKPTNQQQKKKAKKQRKIIQDNTTPDLLQYTLMLICLFHLGYELGISEFICLAQMQTTQISQCNIFEQQQGKN